MPRPITKKDIKRWRERYSFRLTVKTDEVLGLFIKIPVEIGGLSPYAYSAGACGDPIWVSWQTIRKRKRSGHPKKKPKQFLREPDFGLEEMALAEQIMNGG